SARLHCYGASSVHEAAQQTRPETLRGRRKQKHETGCASGLTNLLSETTGAVSVRRTAPARETVVGDFWQSRAHPFADTDSRREANFPHSARSGSPSPSDSLS